jgi:hypothetical protein
MLSVLALSSITALGCGDSDEPPMMMMDDGLPAAPAPGEWIEVVPGGDTICSRGTEYRFFVRGGRPDRVIIDFQGGGACWNQLTCSIADALFSDQAGTLDGFVAAIDADVIGGLFSSDPSSPFADWTIVHVPYCTGDVHWGNATQDYGMGVTIEHKGFVNASAALAWTYSRYEAPANVFVTGCSAGAYGAALHSAYIADHYADARVSVLADSGAGIITDDFLLNSLPRWNAQPNLPSFVPGLDVPIAELTLPDLYVAIGNAFPEHRFAQTATAFDQDQIFFYTAMGGEAADWPGLFRTSIDAIDTELPNFAAYIPPGSMHCATPYPFFDTRTVNGTHQLDWAVELAMGETMPATVACEGAECCDDPVCEACAADDSPSYCRFCSSWPPDWSECAAAMP